MAHPNEVEAIVRQELEEFKKDLEANLTVAFRKALDTVTTEYDERLKDLEYDVARLLRHSGMKDD